MRACGGYKVSEARVVPPKGPIITQIEQIIYYPRQHTHPQKLFPRPIHRPYVLSLPCIMYSQCTAMHWGRALFLSVLIYMTLSMRIIHQQDPLDIRSPTNPVPRAL